MTFTTAVSSSAGTPTGAVTLMDGSTTLGTSTLTSGQAIFSTSSLSVGTHTSTAQYGGGSGFSASSGSLTQQVEFGVCVLYDQTKSVNSGAVFPIKLDLCDANDIDPSSSAIVVHATSVTAISGFSGAPEAVGNTNQDNAFRFDSTLGPSGGYIFNFNFGITVQ